MIAPSASVYHKYTASVQRIQHAEDRIESDNTIFFHLIV